MMYTTDGFRIILDGYGPIAYAADVEKEKVDLLVDRANLFVADETLIESTIETLQMRHKDWS